jgi:hypothetical protein
MLLDLILTNLTAKGNKELKQSDKLKFDGTGRET